MMSLITDAITSASGLQIAGMVLLVIGVIGMLFSSYRYLLAYMLAGMGYWLGIESISFVLQQFNFTAVNAYVSAIGFSMVGVFMYIVATESKRQKKRAMKKQQNYIEHTPLYEGEVPTSKG